MRVSVVVNQRFFRTAAGPVYTRTCLSYSHWSKYLRVFDRVQVIARVKTVAHCEEPVSVAEGPGVSFFPVPDYQGLWQYLLKLPKVEGAVHRAEIGADAVILRIPSHLTLGIWRRLCKEGKPYGVEVVGDSHAEFAPGAVSHPLRPLFRQFFSRLQQQQCAQAAAAAYVTRDALQRRYRPADGIVSTSYSDVELPPEAVVTAPRSAPSTETRRVLLCVASLAQLYKGPDILLKSVASCVRKGLDIRLSLVGDGKHRIDLQRLARHLGVEGRVNFAGELPAGEAIREQMDRADLFVLPSRTEGLPRALIEAMARGLPCVASNVGGIPEIIPPEDLVPPGDPDALADKICEVFREPGRMARMSARNLAEAEKYREESQSAARLAFYEGIKEATKRWLEEDGVWAAHFIRTPKNGNGTDCESIV
jgi:glycosyltransferase involved in cell wall biosynthesis